MRPWVRAMAASGMVALGLLGVPGPSPAQAGAPAARTAARTEARTTAQLLVHTTTVEFGPTSAPRLTTVECVEGEQLVSGGYVAADPSLRVVDSYPSNGAGTPSRAGEQPRGWSVGVVNDTRKVVRLQVVAACLADTEAQARVQVSTGNHSESGFSSTVDCPNGTVRAGGGYSSVWARNLGTAAVVGSYPGPGRRWGIDVVLLPGDPDVKPRATVSVYAVCLSGAVSLGGNVAVNLDLVSGPPTCGGGDANFAAVCVSTRSGARRVGCGEGQLLLGAGFQVSAGTLPGDYSVLVNAPTAEGFWNIEVRGVGPTNAATPSVTSLRVSALCLAAVAVPVGTQVALPSDTPIPTVSAGHRDWPLLAGAAAAVLALILMVLTLSLWRRSRSARRRPPPAPQLEVAVRAQHSTYRLSRFREIP